MVQINQSNPIQNHPTLAITLGNLGVSLRDLGKHKEAQKCFEGALAIQGMAYDQNHPTLAITLGNLGVSLRDLGKHKEAQKCFEGALAIQEMRHMIKIIQHWLHKSHSNLLIETFIKGILSPDWFLSLVQYA